MNEVNGLTWTLEDSSIDYARGSRRAACHFTAGNRGNEGNEGDEARCCGSMVWSKFTQDPEVKVGRGAWGVGRWCGVV